jgi:hypothetical protein
VTGNKDWGEGKEERERISGKEKKRDRLVRRNRGERKRFGEKK